MYKRDDMIHKSLKNNALWMTWIDWVDDSTQWFLNVHKSLEWGTWV